MATEFPEEPEVDLGFRNAGPELSSDGHDENPIQTPSEPFVSKRLKPSAEPLSARGWLLRMLLVIAFSAAGALISSIFFFNHPERFTVLKHLIRETYVLPTAMKEDPAANLPDFRIDRVPIYKIGNDFGEGGAELKFSPDLKPTVSVFPQWLSLYDPHASVPDASLFAGPRSVAPLIFSSAVAVTAPAPATLMEERQTRSVVRSAVERRSLGKATLRRRSVRRAARSARPIASFWSLWSRHFFVSGTAAVTTRRRLGKRESRAKKAKQSFWLASSWRAIAAQPNLPRSRTKLVIRSRASAMRGPQPAIKRLRIPRQHR